MNELAKALTADSAHATPAQILEALDEPLAYATAPGAPRTIYQELWHITYWQQVSLDWIGGIETPSPSQNDLSFPTAQQAAQEPWEQLCRRFFHDNQLAGAAASDESALNTIVRCPSPPGLPTRSMTIREQLESLAAHNAYHFGRIVLLRQMLASWPPPSGGFSW
jgi:uncharacterized damage-inducible protein DinB